jgi:hypothetical protein
MKTLLLCTLPLAAALALYSPAALAQSDTAAARALFNDARKLVANKKYTEACPKFEESYRLEAGMGTAFNLADCWEKLGRSASAWAKFLDVAAEAQRSGQAEREKIARSRAAALEPKLSRLVVEVQGAASGTEVRRDGALVGSASWGTPVPVDPGKHTIEVKAPGKVAFATSVELRAGGDAETVRIPALADATPSATPQAAPAAQPALADTKSRSASAYVGYGLVGVGVVGVAVGTLFGLKYRSKNDEATGLCPLGRCTSPAEVTQHDADVSDAKSARTLSYVGFGLGAAALATGVALIVTSPKSPTATGARIEPVVLAGGGGLAVGGAF